VQFAKPIAHDESQMPDAHWRDPTLELEHARPQAPQLFTSAARLSSQPFAVTPSQFPKSGLHDAIEQEPDEQPATAFASVHLFMQTPQF
jgi:hypothetical protein